MKNSIRFAALTCFAGLVSLAPMAKADEWNKKTILTVKEAIQLPQCCGPNIVLEPGTYSFKLLDSASDRHIVQVFDSNDHIITTILAIPNYRIRPTGKTEFTFWEVPAGQPPAMRAWFYPGDNFGQEFAYPKSAATQIAATANAPVPTTEAQTREELATAPVTTTPAPEPQQTTEPEPTQVAQNTPPPAPEAAPAPEPPAPQAAPQELPKTGSPYPLIGLAGVFSLGLFALVRALRMV